MIIKQAMEGCRSVGDYAYAVLKDNILTLHLEPGRKISEMEISEKLKVSRTPVREAIIKLAKEGIVQVQSQRGTLVSKIDLAFVEEARFVRRALEEKVIASLAPSFSSKDEETCRRILARHKQVPEDNYDDHFYYDGLFHKTLYSAAGKERTWDMVDRLGWDYHRIRYLALVDLTKMSGIIQDHEDILNALSCQDAAASAKAVCRHIDRWLEESAIISDRHPEHFKAPLRA